MDTDDSILITELTKRMNECLSQGQNSEDIDDIAIENDIIYSADIVPDSLRNYVKKRSRKIGKSRLRTARQVRRNIARKWGPALDLLDQCLAIADLINARLARAIFANSGLLRSKDPRPVPIIMTGAYVRCLHLLGLYGKSCRIATEISYLLREGFPDGAISRFRTLHEHLVIMVLLNNDHTYELSEGYQDSALFDRLKQLRADQKSFASPFYRQSNVVAEELAEEIEKLEHAAAEIIARRGPKIKGPYEWARPILPEPKKNNLRYAIKFSDIEEVAGMDFLRRNYLLGNERIHAGAYTVINHLDFTQPEISSIRQRCDDWAIHFVGSGIPDLIGWAARAACKAIAWETEEYDELLYVCEIQRAADAAADAFVEVRVSPSPSSL